MVIQANHDSEYEMTEICECGHKGKDHYKDMIDRTFACKDRNCICEEFEVQESVIINDNIKPKNHSHPEETSRVNSFGSDTFNLSDKIWRG